MSKNFELMQQMDKERLSRPDSAEELVAQAQDGRDNHRSKVRWANDEALRLVQQVFLLQTREPPRVVIFAGVDHGSGCSQMCASVAETLALNASRPVCLVEANFRKPGLSELFETINQHGLTEALVHGGPVGAYLKPVYQEKLWLLSSGTLAADSANLLTAGNLQETIRELRQQFEFIVIDAPPLSHFADAIVIGQMTDGLVLVLEAGATRREAASVVTANLRSANIPILAAVLNNRTFPIPEKLYRRL